MAAGVRNRVGDAEMRLSRDRRGSQESDGVSEGWQYVGNVVLK